ncbi:hypothetical protein JKP88DRAFT_219809 [Tribonema minus]|uniref:Uncharacterized protein n=1 Tax=Tribonema minus TaxID=303371 RepID=A0A835YZ02_9STRA|nr:hypothetical protein JKP88DRAFT_219809 [Tribonema minus]
MFTTTSPAARARTRVRTRPPPPHAPHSPPARLRFRTSCRRRRPPQRRNYIAGKPLLLLLLQFLLRFDLVRAEGGPEQSAQRHDQADAQARKDDARGDLVRELRLEVRRVVRADSGIAVEKSLLLHDVLRSWLRCAHAPHLGSCGPRDRLRHALCCQHACHVAVAAGN